MSVIPPYQGTRIFNEAINGYRYPASLSISLVQEAAHKNSVNKGFWEGDFNVAEKLMLIVSELSEALEKDRSTKNLYVFPTEAFNFLESIKDEKTFSNAFKNSVKDSFGDEMADVVIRVADLCGKLGINLERHVNAKMRYNSTRPHKHGKEY